MGVFDQAQSDILRAEIEGKKEGELVEWDKVSLESCIEFLVNAATSSRMTKEGNEAWAKIALAEACKARGEEICKAKGYSEGSEPYQKQCDAVLATYAAIAGKCSASVPNVGQDEAISFQKMLERAQVSDDIAKAIGKKLHKILNPAVASDNL